ncbi:DinB family protein [Paenibacillus terreus]|uniref:DinB family protein n=1 Tax=Paenibacillus terreus TaxID=1387834 RepID=A0ABV5BDX6_9BACL
MYTTINGFLNDWKQEAELTLQVLDKLTDASLNQAVSDAQPRTIGEIAWHIVQSVPFFLVQIGLQQEIPTPEQGSASAIAQAYRRVCEAAVAELSANWADKDEKLPEMIKVFGVYDMTVADVLNQLVRHQIHHRGQLTILMRQAGLAAPGVYGPNEEETAAMRAAQANS